MKTHALKSNVARARVLAGLDHVNEVLLLRLAQRLKLLNGVDLHLID